MKTISLVVIVPSVYAGRGVLDALRKRLRLSTPAIIYVSVNYETYRIKLARKHMNLL